MQLSKQTLEILKNFSNINQNLSVKPGSVIKTISAAQNVFAEVTVQEEFPKEFGIYNMSEFLATLSLFKEPNLDFSDKYVTISEGKVKVRYSYADPSILITPPDRQVKLQDTDIKFTITAQQFQALQKASGVLSVTDLLFTGNGSTIEAVACDKKNGTQNKYAIDLDQDSGREFKAYFKIDLLKFIPVDFEVQISKKSARFTNEDTKITYYVAVEADSEI